jgi:hypothetical protein
MSADDLDRLVRGAMPPAKVTEDRAARVMAGVMARLDQGCVRRPRRPFLALLAGRLAGLPSLPRFAVPMAAAALLGIVVGQGLRPAENAAVLDQLFVTSSSFYAGTGY